MIVHALVGSNPYPSAGNPDTLGYNLATLRARALLHSPSLIKHQRSKEYVTSDTTTFNTSQSCRHQEIYITLRHATNMALPHTQHYSNTLDPGYTPISTTNSFTHIKIHSSNHLTQLPLLRHAHRPTHTQTDTMV